MDEAPICALGGAVFELPGKLDGLLRHGHMLPKGAECEIPLIKRDLEEIISILQDHISRSEDPSVMVNCWMKEVRELSYDIEDCIDQYEHSADSKSKYVCKIPRRKFTSRKTNRLSEKLKQRLWMANKIREFSARVQEALQRHQMYNLGDIGRTTTINTTYDASLRSPHHKLYREAADPVGIDAPMNKLEEWLIKDGEQKLKVVSIVGVGGIGKTTLANELYCKLGGQFDCRAFVRASQKPDMRRLLISMLSQVWPHHPPDTWKVHNLIADIKTHLQDKRYLIVVDDVWATSTWDIVNRALPDDNRSSRILLTTEIEDVAHKCCGYDSKYVFMMKPLGGDDSRKLFFNTVFGPQHECPPELSEVSNSIIRKCGGLPLSTVTIANLLASQMGKPEQWDHVHRSLGYGLGKNTTLEGMKQVLNLCYNNLPHHLKACMLYLSIYEEDHIIWKGDLVKQWIAEGFICATEDQDKEEISGSYFDELVSRRMIQPIHINDNDEVLSCVVHHMVLNLITYKSIEENFVIAIDHSQTTARLVDKVRRLSLHFSNAEDATPPTNMRLSQIRTLAFFGVYKCLPSILELRLVQVLILHFWGDEESISLDLTRISKLIRLKYLEVACNVTLELRTQMQGLQYLETLKIDARASAVPSDIVHLPGLLHLNLPAQTNLPNGIGHITSLLTLGCFDISGNSIANVRNLGELTNLRDLQLTCSTTTSGYLECTLECLGSILGKLNNLKSLTLVPSSSSYVNTVDAAARSMSISCDGLGSMSSPPALLQRLDWLPRICIFASLPKWIGQLGKLCILKIGVRELARNDVDVLRGLPALTVLSLYVRTKPPEMIVFDKEGFSVLKYFKFRCGVPCLKFEADAMPNLRKLKLGFNALGADQHGTAAISIEHLSGLREISAKIGGAKADAESTLMTAISNHPSNPRINVQLVDCIFCGDESRSMGTKEKEHMTIEEQDETLEEDTHECYTTQGEDSGEDENKQADSRVGGEQHDKLYRITSATEYPDASGSNSLVKQEQESEELRQGPWTGHSKGSRNALARATELKKDESKPAIVEDATVSSWLHTPFGGYHKQQKTMATVSASQGAMGSLLGKLGDLLADKYKLLKEAKDEIRFLKDELESMHVFLMKMSDVQEPDEQAKCWVKEVRELSYDIEDNIDEFMLRIERDSNNKPHGFRGFIDRCLCLLTTIRTRHQITKEFQGLNERSTRYKVDDAISKTNNTPIDPHMLALYADTAGLAGIDEPREELIRLMMDEEGVASQQLKVLSIVGFGGLGKTTLANEIYRKLEGQFQCRSFVSVSQKPNVRKILRNILSQVGCVAPEQTNMEIWDEHELISTLQKFLTEKRYIIVIDDIWDADAWNIIRCALPENKNGSRVITTTRIETVAAVCCSNHYEHVYKMRPLSNEDSRRLFFKRIFGSEGACPPNLEEVSAEILTRCGGLPLAVITISSLLASRRNKLKEHWEHVRDSLGSNLEVNPTLDGMRQILSLSYISLPHYLKTCMLYLGIYPEDYTIHKYDLVRQWVAEGFISKALGCEPEDVAEGYFNELVNRSIIQPVDTDPNDDVLSCRVHDMMLDLIVHKCIEENFITAIDDIQDITRLHDKVRRLSLYLDGVIDGSALGTVQLSQVRALARFGTSTYIPPLLEFKHLRVLTLEFPSGKREQVIIDLTGMCHLFQLSYLKIVAHGKIVLPSEIRGLQQLETLEIETKGYWGSSMVEVPSDVVHLRRLLHLIVPPWIRLPDGIGNMKSILTLRHFILDINSIETIRDLGYLTNLRDLEIKVFVRQGRLDDIMAARERMDVLRSSLEKLCNLKYLRMHSYLHPYFLWDEFSRLYACPRLLQRLLMWCQYSRVPKWTGELHNLYDLKLRVKEVREDDVRILAQLPSLINLDLFIWATPKEDVVICGTGFPVLKHFSICCSRISYLTFEAGAMPRLQKLKISFNAKGWNKYGAAPTGIDHLSGLMEISVTIWGAGAKESDRRAAQSALRNAIDVHPARPIANIVCQHNASVVFDEETDIRATQSALRNAIDVHSARPIANIEYWHQKRFGFHEEEDNNVTPEKIWFP